MIFKFWRISSELESNTVYYRQQILAIQQQITAIKQQITAIQQQITAIKQQITAIQQQITVIQQRIMEKEKQISSNKTTQDGFTLGALILALGSLLSWESFPIDAPPSRSSPTTSLTNGGKSPTEDLQTSQSLSPSKITDGIAKYFLGVVFLCFMSTIATTWLKQTIGVFYAYCMIVCMSIVLLTLRLIFSILLGITKS